MNIFFVQLFSLVGVIFKPLFVQGALISLNDSPHVMNLYHNLWNADPPTARDPAASDDPEIRKNICKDITYNGLELLYDMGAVDMTRAYEELQCEQYSEMFHQIYGFANSPDTDDKYTNKYKQIFYHDHENEDFTEYVFVCLMRTVAGNLTPFYVTKEYDVAPIGQPFKPGRFIFPDQFVPGSSLINLMVLAEEPVVPYSEPGFDVILYFHQIRKYIPIAESNELDPLCRLFSDDNDDPNNQHYRICVAVSRSAIFKDFVEYPFQSSRKCEVMEVSFFSNERQEENLYYERMSPCHLTLEGTGEGVSLLILPLYISRAYGSNQILVHVMNQTNGKVYPINLSTNVSVVDELNSFDLVED